MKKPVSQYSINNYGFNNFGRLKWTGTFWVVSKGSCANLDPNSIYFENRKHNCRHKGHPIVVVPRTDQGFTVTEEKLEEMEQDGRLDRLTQMGVRIDGDADPLYFDWHNQIAKELKNTSKRTNQKYMELYPYLELPTLSDIDFDTGENALEYLTNKASEFYTGESIPRRHEATLRFISKTSDVTLLENAKNRYISVLEDMTKANDNPTQAGIEKAFNRGMELLGNSPITNVLNFGYEKIKRLVRVMTNINRKELQAIKDRLKDLSKSYPTSTTTKRNSSKKSSSNENEKQNLSKYVMPTLTTLTIFLLFKYLGEK